MWVSLGIDVGVTGFKGAPACMGGVQEHHVPCPYTVQQGGSHRPSCTISRCLLGVVQLETLMPAGLLPDLYV